MLENLITVTEPTVEPVTIDEVKAHLRLDASNYYLAPSELTAELAGTAGNVDDGVHRYKVTFVTADGETEGGTASAAVTVADKTADGQISLTNIPVGDTGVTARKIYRTEAGGSDYLLLTTISDNTTTTYTDNTADSSLGAEVPSTNTTADPYLTMLIQAAREMAEAYTKRGFITQTHRLELTAFPRGTAIFLPKGDIQSVTSVVYTDGDGVEQTLSTSSYDVQTSWPGVINLADGYTWPDTKKTLGAVKITFVAGYGDTAADVPQTIKQGMLMLIGHYYNNRESTIVGTSASEIPMTSKSLLSPHVVSI